MVTKMAQRPSQKVIGFAGHSAAMRCRSPIIFMAACLQIPGLRRADYMFACVAATWIVGAVIFPRDRRRL